MAIYVCSDIHGFYDRYIKMLDKIKFNNSDTLYILGDVIDRGPDGIKILQDIIKRPNIIMFIGNHEFMMLEYLKKANVYGDYDDNWLSENNGGLKTLNEFRKLSVQEQNDILFFLKNKTYLQKVININNIDYMLCHAFYNKKCEDLLFKDASTQVVDMMVWYSPFRNDFLNVPFSFYDKKYKFIVGHVPTVFFSEEAPFSYKNLINIDGGCAISAFNEEYGNLCCIKLDDFETERFYVNIR